MSLRFHNILKDTIKADISRILYGISSYMTLDSIIWYKNSLYLPLLTNVEEL